jgi:hypothetical protein
MGNRTLYTVTGDVLTLRGVDVWAEGLDMLALVGDDPN